MKKNCYIQCCLIFFFLIGVFISTIYAIYCSYTAKSFPPHQFLNYQDMRLISTAQNHPFASVRIDQRNMEVIVFYDQGYPITKDYVEACVLEADGYKIIDIKSSKYDGFTVMQALSEIREKVSQYNNYTKSFDFDEEPWWFQCWWMADNELGPRIYACFGSRSNPPSKEVEIAIRELLAAYGDMVIWVTDDQELRSLFNDDYTGEQLYKTYASTHINYIHLPYDPGAISGTFIF